MSIGYTLRFITKQGREAEFESFLTRMAAVVRVNDAGCLDYDLYRHASDPRRFAFVERWATEDDMRAHAAKPHFKEFQRMNEMLDAPPELLKHAE